MKIFKTLEKDTLFIKTRVYLTVRVSQRKRSVCQYVNVELATLTF
jgi:hypothetical protein